MRHDSSDSQTNLANDGGSTTDGIKKEEADASVADGGGPSGAIGVPSKTEEGDRVVDLDTRLKMLMQKQGTTGLPSFLVGFAGGDEEEEEKAEEVKNEPEPREEEVEPTLLTRPPSPFLSGEIYQQCFEENR